MTKVKFITKTGLILAVTVFVLLLNNISVNALTLSKNLNVPKGVQGKVSFLAVQQNLIDTVNNRQKNENIDNSIKIIESFPGYDLYIFPELSVTGYSRKTFDNLNILAEAPSTSSKTFKHFSKVAKEIKAYIIFSIPTYYYAKRSNEKKYHISAFVVSPEGKLVSVYNKSYLFTMEQEYFTGGWTNDVENPISVIDINGVRLGLAICYDMRYPELWREMCMKHGVIGYLQILCIEKDFSFPSWHTIAKARAIENQAYVLSLNRSGSEYGCSIFIQPGTPDIKDYELAPNYQTLNNNEGVIGGVIDGNIINQIRKKVTVVKDGISVYPKYKTLDNSSHSK